MRSQTRGTQPAPTTTDDTTTITPNTTKPALYTTGNNNIDPDSSNDFDDLPGLRTPTSCASSDTDSFSNYSLPPFFTQQPTPDSSTNSGAVFFCIYHTANMTSIGEYQQGAPMKPPTLTPGEVMPEQLQKWEMGCSQYFFHKDIAADDQVKRVTWGLLDPQIQQWYSVENGRLNALTFNSFMDKLRRFWLPSDWASELCLKMLSSHQGSHPFHEWVVDIQTQNSILVNDTAHMSNANLRYHFEAHMHKDLAIEYRTSDAKDETDLHK